jgi:hypothetical protein
MAGLHVEAEGVTRGAQRPCESWSATPAATAGGAVEHERLPGLGRDVGGPARTHAAERCANAAVHTFSCAPHLSDPRGVR